MTNDELLSGWVLADTTRRGAREVAQALAHETGAALVDLDDSVDVVDECSGAELDPAS